LLFVSCTNVAQVFFVKDVLGAGDTGYGVVGACWMVGMVLAVPLVAPGQCTRSALATLVVAGEAVTGVAVLGAGLSSSPVMVGVWYLLAGLGSSAMMIAGAALVGLVAPGETRGRVLAAYSTLANAAMAAALGLSVVLMGWLGARGVFLAAGALTVMAATLAAGALRNWRGKRRCRRGPRRRRLGWGRGSP
jgi:MFS family permease